LKVPVWLFATVRSMFGSAEAIGPVLPLPFTVPAKLKTGVASALPCRCRWPYRRLPPGRSNRCW
jgi:hypothetical protein